MAIRDGNKTVQITLTKFHQNKLNVMCGRMGLKKSEVIQRLIEQYDVFMKQQTPEDQKASEG